MSAQPGIRNLATVTLLAAAAACGPDAPPEQEGPPPDPLLRPANFQETAPATFDVLMETTEGEIRVRVHRDWAPLGADRFYNLVKAGFYDGVPFHRVLEGFTAGFGIHADPYVNAVWREARLMDDPVTQTNARGRLSFSKSRSNSRTVQVFVNLKDNPSLDEDGFAPFAEVVEGMDVVDALYAGYGDGPPRGEGVYQAMAIAKGEEYFVDFPELDRIESARVVEPGA